MALHAAASVTAPMRTVSNHPGEQPSCTTDQGMIPVEVFLCGVWITAHLMYCLNKKSTHITSKWRMSAVLAMMKLGFLSCPILLQTK